MSQSRHFMLAILLGVVIAIGGSALLAWPAYRESVRVRDEIALLQVKIAEQDTHVAAVERFASRVAKARQEMESNQKSIPADADVAMVMRKLSMPVDGDSVFDQTFSAGTVTPALPDDDTATVQQLPITVDLACTFNAVFSLLRDVETMDNLVRVSAMHLAAERVTNRQQIPREASEAPVLTASVVMDLLFDPGDGQP